MIAERAKAAAGAHAGSGGHSTACCICTTAVALGSDRRPLYAHARGHAAVLDRAATENRCAPACSTRYAHGRLTIANALGNGVGDDKAVYAYVPAAHLVLSRRGQCWSRCRPTCAPNATSATMCSTRLDQLVVKPVDGFGGYGITIGPESSEAELDARRLELLAQPERFIAQDVVALSTHPTFDGTGFHPHHVDLRAFVHLRPGPATADRTRCAGGTDPSGAGGQHDRQLLQRRWRQGHLDPRVEGDRMCGLCGEIRFDGAAPDIAAVGRMCAAMAPRGPDGSGVHEHGAVAFGHRRLSIIDLSDRGRASRWWTANSGSRWCSTAASTTTESCVTNCAALGYRFFSSADSEVVLKGFHAWGTRCVDRFKGMFAFADRGAAIRAPSRSPATGSASSRSISPSRRAGCGSRPRSRPCCAAGGVDTRSTGSRCTIT